MGWNDTYTYSYKGIKNSQEHTQESGKGVESEKYYRAVSFSL